MEWTQALIPIVSSCAMTIAAMPLFIGYFQMKKQGQAIQLLHIMLIQKAR